MFKRLSLISLVAASMVLTVACKSSKKVEDNPTAAEGDASKMDANVQSKDMKYDQAGSDSGQINGLNSIHFDYDSATLSTEARRQLAENADWIKTNASTTVQIEGHCDSRGSVEYNLALGERRAKSVKNYMTSLGVASNRMTIISYGEEKPLDSADSEEAYAKNRRANFVPLAQ